MDMPKITVDGKEFTMAAPKCRMWRTWMAFDKEKGNLAPEEFIERHCALIAEVFPGLTADDLLDNVDLDEVILIYNRCLLALMQLLSSRLELLGKNADAAES